MEDTRESRRVLITGGTGSIGRVLVAAFASQGDRVTLQYNTNREVALQLHEQFGVAYFAQDFSAEFSIPETDFDVLINNAGINIANSNAHEIPLSSWLRTMMVNAAAPFRLSQLCLPHMVNRRWGRIINISSIYGLRGVENNLPYTMSKHALSGMTKTIAKEYSPYGITCNELSPGPVNSSMMNRVSSSRAAAEGRSIDEYMNDVFAEIPMRRLCEAQDIADMAVYLASDQAS